MRAGLPGPEIKPATLRFLVWHEYLHLHLKAGHTTVFRELEKQWPDWARAVELGRVGEVERALPTGHVLLLEEDLALGAVQRAPSSRSSHSQRLPRSASFRLPSSASST